MTTGPPLLPSAFMEFSRGPYGGGLWQGVIPNRFVRGASRVSIIYLPPHVSRSRRYPVFYGLHGLPGSPYSIGLGLRFADVADRMIRSGRLVPFIGVFPVAGTNGHFHGEWTAGWESYVVDGVVPWVDAHLPTIARPSGRAIAGLSAGAYGAVDIGLRHPRVFRTLESWSGYFHPIADGSLRGADAAQLAAHDPTLLAESRAPLLRRLGVRFFLSCGSTHDRATAALAREFAAVLTSLGIRHELYLAPGGHNGRFWFAQLPAALAYAEGTAH